MGKIITVIVIAMLICLGVGVFALLNWQTTPVLWAQPIVFVFGCISLMLVGMLIIMLIDFITWSKD